MPRVLNKYKIKKNHPGVYIGRPSPYGNPFVVGKDGTRDEVVDKFEQLFLSNPKAIEIVKKNLRGMDLICFCAPLRCHGDILLKIANELNFNYDNQSINSEPRL